MLPKSNVLLAQWPLNTPYRMGSIYHCRAKYFLWPVISWAAQIENGRYTATRDECCGMFKDCITNVIKNKTLCVKRGFYAIAYFYASCTNEFWRMIFTNHIRLKLFAKSYVAYFCILKSKWLQNHIICLFFVVNIFSYILLYHSWFFCRYFC